MHLNSSGVHRLLHRADQIAPQIPSVGDLHCVRCADPDSVGVDTGSVATHDLGTGMCLQPGGVSATGSVGQQTDRATGDQIYYDGSVDVATMEREVVDPQDRCGLDRSIRNRPHDTGQCVPTDVNSESGSEVGTGTTGHGQSDRLDHRGEHRGSPSPPLCQSRYLLGECCGGAGVVAAEESAAHQIKDDGMGADCRVGGLASIP